MSTHCVIASRNPTWFHPRDRSPRPQCQRTSPCIVLLVVVIVHGGTWMTSLLDARLTLGKVLHVLTRKLLNGSSLLRTKLLHRVCITGTLHHADGQRPVVPTAPLPSLRACDCDPGGSKLYIPEDRPALRQRCSGCGNQDGVTGPMKSRRPQRAQGDLGNECRLESSQHFPRS